MDLRATSDQQLTINICRLARSLRADEVELLIHLSEMQLRQLSASLGYPSLFAYCVKELKFSEGTTCRRLAAARVLTRFPAAKDYLVDGRLHTSALAMLEKHLTAENHASALAKAAGRTKTELAWLLAELSPRPDEPASIRKLPTPRSALDPEPKLFGQQSGQAAFSHGVNPVDMRAVDKPADGLAVSAAQVPKTSVDLSASGARTPSLTSKAKPVSQVEPLSPQRVLIKCSADAAVATKIQRARELLAHKFPGGELEHILDAALDALLERVAPERKAARKAAREASSRRAKPTSPSQDAPSTDNVESRSKPVPDGTSPFARPQSPFPSATSHSPVANPHCASTTRSRYIPASAKLAAWQEAQGQCTYISPDGRRCSERRALQFDHVQPFALGGSNDSSNIRCYCRTHNAFAALKTYGDTRHRHQASAQPAYR